MTKQTIEVDVPEGWIAIRYGKPKKDEDYISVGGSIQRAKCDWGCGDRLIIQKEIERENQL